MTNQTPPAWATQAAIQLSALDGDESITLEYMAKVIIQHAPDAEALAVALEACIQDLKSEGLGTSGNEKQVLTAYRARFPKVSND